MNTAKRNAVKSDSFADLKAKLLFVLGALVVYRVGSHIPVPGIDPKALAIMFEQQSGSILDMFNMFSGGALMRLSIFALGIMPYISASIIMQLMTVVIPFMEQIKKEGEAGRKKNFSVHTIWYCCSRFVSRVRDFYCIAKSDGRWLVSCFESGGIFYSNYYNNFGNRYCISDVAW